MAPKGKIRIREIGSAGDGLGQLHQESASEQRGVGDNGSDLRALTVAVSSLHRVLPGDDV